MENENTRITKARPKTRNIIRPKTARKEPVGTFHHPTEKTYRDGKCPEGTVTRKGYYRHAYVTKEGKHVRPRYIRETCVQNKGIPGKIFDNLKPIHLDEKNILKPYNYNTNNDKDTRFNKLLKAMEDLSYRIVITRLSQLRALTKDSNTEHFKIYNEDIIELQKWRKENPDLYKHKKVNEKKVNVEKVNVEKVNEKKVNEKKVNSNVVNSNVVNGNVVNDNEVNSNVVNGNVVNGNKVNSNVVNGNKVNGNVVNSQEEQASKGGVKELVSNDQHYFLRRLQTFDNKLFNYDVKNKQYSKCCQTSIKHPVVLPYDPSKNKSIDKDSYTYAMKYGSNPKKENWYICPKVWCPHCEIPISESDIDNKTIKKSKKMNECKIAKCPFGDHQVFIREKDNKTYAYPGFVKKSYHPDGLSLPCCFLKSK